MVSFRKVMAVATAAAFAGALLSFSPIPRRRPALASDSLAAVDSAVAVVRSGLVAGGSAWAALGDFVRDLGHFVLERSTAADGTADLGLAFMPEGTGPDMGATDDGTVVAAGMVVVGADRLRPAFSGGLALGAIAGNAGYYGDGYADYYGDGNYGYGYGPGDYDSGYGCHFLRDPVRGHNGHVIYYPLVRPFRTPVRRWTSVCRGRS
jgi:hypothetical protein